MSNETEYETLHPVLSLVLPVVGVVICILPAVMQIVLHLS